jgi:NAD(P)-dependent dehydrogenase (short-subunit alcohol dehydrogenase family)
MESLHYRIISVDGGSNTIQSKKGKHMSNKNGQKLAGKIAVVTGASRGIGRASALALAKEGARIIAHYNSASDEAQKLVEEIQKLGGKAEAVGADLAAADGAHQLAAKVRKIAGKKLDIVVANAGISHSCTIEEQTVEEFDRLFAVNVRAPFFLVQQLLPLLADGSSVTMVSSLAARAAVANLAVYSATKGAVSTLVKHFAAALGPKGIRVNAVAPGVIETDMSHFARTKEGREFTLSIQALQRVGQPDDVAGVVAFLASDDARWITGDIVEISGGSKL